MDSQDFRAAHDSGRPALHAAPELARFAFHDCAGEALSALVHPDAAADVLCFGHRRGTGDDDLRILAQQPRLRTGARIAIAGQYGAGARGGPELLLMDPVPGSVPSECARAADTQPHRDLAFRSGDRTDGGADGIAVPGRYPHAPRRTVRLRRDGT